MYASAFDFYSLLNLLALQQSPSIPEVLGKSQEKSRAPCKEKLYRYGVYGLSGEAKNRWLRQRKTFFTRNGANKILSPDHLKIVWFSVLLSNPLTKDDFPSCYIAPCFILSFLSARGWSKT
jgi:hypothetical protein